MPAPKYLSLLRNIGQLKCTSSDKLIDVFELGVPTDEDCLRDWASRFRQSYCLDSEIDALRRGTGKSRADYLTDLVFPDKAKAPGPGVRAGDFAELLISDYVEYVLGYWVPRGKYAEKATRNESVKGVDIIGFRTIEAGKAHPNDTLLVFEVKAQLSETAYDKKLQRAVDDSDEDFLRSAFTLNATKRRLLHDQRQADADLVERFQNLADNPYIYKSGAAAVLSDTAYDPTALAAVDPTAHRNIDGLTMIVVKGAGLLDLSHALYARAANEA